MCGLRTLCRTLPCLILPLQALPAFADATPAAFAVPSLPADPVHLFATCTGRLSALREFQWLMGDAGSDRTSAVRQGMIDLAEAVTPPERAAEAMSWRVQAKASFAALLSDAGFSPDEDLRALAGSRAERMAEECRALVLMPDQT